MAFPHKFCCTLCGKIITNGQIHRFCAKNKSCYHCHRRALTENQYYDALCRTTFCPNNLKNHYAVEIANKQCPTCYVEVASKSCYDLHIKICQGQKKCENCGRIITANTRNGETLEKKIQDHICYESMCRTCFIKLPPGENDKNQHCCQLTKPIYPSFFPQLGFFDLECAEFGKQHVHMDQLLCFSYERKFAGIFQRNNISWNIS